MVELNERLGPQGLVIIGISLDRSLGDLNSKKPKGFTWPQYLDQGSKVSSHFGVKGIPHVFLLGPDGKVLWRGHPAGGLDQQLQKAFKEHPPQLTDPKMLAKANETLAQIETAVKSGEAAAAIKLLGKLPAEAKKDAEFAARAEEVQKGLEVAARAMLAEVEPQIEAGKYAEAVARLRELTAALNGLPVGEEAKKRLGALQSDPAVRSAIESGEKQARSGEELAVARKLKAESKHELAYKRYKDVVQLFPGTPAATEAAVAVKEYEKDPKFVQRANESAAATKGKAALSIARSYRTAGRTQQAKQKYQSIIKEFPGTTYAKTAEEELKALR